MYLGQSPPPKKNIKKTKQDSQVMLGRATDESLKKVALTACDTT